MAWWDSLPPCAKVRPWVLQWKNSFLAAVCLNCVNFSNIFHKNTHPGKRNDMCALFLKDMLIRRMFDWKFIWACWFLQWERRHRSDPGGSESFVAAPQDCWTGVTFFQSDSHGIHGHVQEEKNIYLFLFFFPDGSKNFTPPLFSKGRKTAETYIINLYSCTFCFSSLEFCLFFSTSATFSPPFSGAAHVLQFSAQTKTVPETPGPGNQHHGP